MQDNIHSETQASFDFDSIQTEIYRTYQESIVPLIVAIETYDNEFPVEILNEVRAIFTHFARCHTTDDRHVIEDNAQKAKRHLKRMMFDCNKYITAMYAIRINDFLGAYPSGVLCGVSDGKFLPEVNRKLQGAEKKTIEARTLETKGMEERAQEAYSEAIGLYTELNDYIFDRTDDIAHAEAMYKPTLEGIKTNKRGFVIGVIGVVVGVLGVLSSILVAVFL